MQVNYLPAMPMNIGINLFKLTLKIPHQQCTNRGYEKIPDCYGGGPY